MSEEFTLEIEGLTLVWDVEHLISKTKNLGSFQWEIPSSFLEEYSWGDEHPSTHLQRVLDANLESPIIIWDGIVLDGCHRVCKALAQGRNTISAVEIVNIPPPKDSLDSNPYPHTEKWTFKDIVEITKAVLLYNSKNEIHPLDP
jgi:hypothetical protein